ncbi:MAG: class II aldolase/adducin family protein [bacterium]|nr:class II aldolase/adducin family protein [bacterium]
MERLLKKYANKLVNQGLCESGAPIIGGLDAELVWNRDDERCAVLRDVVTGLNINSILFARPAHPYLSLLEAVAGSDATVILPEDCETRTFLHDIPVARHFSPTPIVEALKRRKSVFIPGEGIVTFGTVSPEQAFVTYRSVCFAGFVKFFTDYFTRRRQGSTNKDEDRIATETLAFYKDHLERLDPVPKMGTGPFAETETIVAAMIEAGRLTVDYKMVDSYFGNLSYRHENTIYISQTASSLDELAGCIDAVPLDGSSCAGITASSEYSTHREILTATDNQAILHGHPKFAVILSMLCEKEACEGRGTCHLKCSEARFAGEIPIVPGEVGTGPHGLCHTLPPAIMGRQGALVYGHGLFTVGKVDFTDAFTNMVVMEQMCLAKYLERL